MLRNALTYMSMVTLSTSIVCAETPVETPRPVPATRPEMKTLLEDMKKRPYRIPIPDQSGDSIQEQGERRGGYESLLRSHYVPASEGSVFGAGRPAAGSRSGGAPAGTAAPRADFTRNADPNMTLTYQFKTMLFWIVSRTNNCQYCLGHQEWKLAATGMTDDQIAALDADWSDYTEAEQAAFRYARLITWEPDRLSDEAIADVSAHYTPMQILEMTMSVSGNNAINRWKEGIGIPQSEGNTFGNRGGSTSAEARHPDTFLTPTAEKYTRAVSIVAPLEIFNGAGSGRGLSRRPPLESPNQVREMLAAAQTRSARLPLVEESVAAKWLEDSEQKTPVLNWVRLLANFPNEGRGRLPSLVSRERQTGELTELRKAQINWIVARQDRAWYAVGQAWRKLAALGQTDEQIFALDESWDALTPADQSLYRLARNLAASPIALTDEDAEAALKDNGPRLVVETINHVASCAYFNRVTEAAGLPLE